MALSNAQIKKIIEIVATAIISIAGTIFVQSCTASLSIQKNTTGSSQKTEQTSSADSTKVNFNPKFQ